MLATGCLYFTQIYEHGTYEINEMDDLYIQDVIFLENRDKPTEHIRIQVHTAGSDFDLTQFRFYFSIDAVYDIPEYMCKLTWVGRLAVVYGGLLTLE